MISRQNSSAVTINCANQDGFTPLHVTAIHGNLKMTKWLLKKGADPKSRTKKLQMTPAHLASLYGNAEVLALLIRGPHGMSCDINYQDSQANTPLHYACLKGTETCANFLIQSKANLDPINWKGNTPLHEACSHGYTNIVSLLLQNGASVRIKNRHGLYPANLSQSTDILQLINKYSSSQFSDVSACSSIDSASLSLPYSEPASAASLRNDICESGVFSYTGDESTIGSNNTDQMVDSWNHDRELEEELAADQALLETIANFQRNSLLLFVDNISDKDDSASVSSSHTNSSGNIDSLLEDSFPMSLTPVRDVYRLSFIEDDNLSM